MLPLLTKLDYDNSGIGSYFGAQCEKQGMLVRVSGDAIMMSPAFIISPDEVDEVGSCPDKTIYTLFSLAEKIIYQILKS